jgi:eukaryotic-like serine/threonine-protein kinase
VPDDEGSDDEGPDNWAAETAPLLDGTRRFLGGSSRDAGLLFGRQDELEALEMALVRVHSHVGVTALIDGNSGVGKTALVEHFLTSAEEAQGAIVLRGRCYEREQVPYQGIDSLIDDICRLLHGLDPVVAEGALPRHLASLVRLFPVLERVPLIARNIERDHFFGGDERDTRRQAFGAFRELLARIADRRLLIVHIDDLQWGDLDTAGLLKEVLRPPDAPPMLLVLGYRREDQEHSPGLQFLTQEPMGDVVRVHLAPLSTDAAKELMRKHLPVSRAQVDVDRLVEEAAGNPFLLHEVVQFAALGKKDDEDTGALDVHAALRARVDRLPLAALELLQTVAIAGHPITEEVARRAADPAASAAEAWRLLVDERLVRFSGPLGARLVETFHDRTRETVLALMSAQRARACHRGLAAALEEAGNADPEVLAQHHRAGKNAMRALDFTVLAAKQATQTLAFDRAARLLKQALEAKELGRARRAELLVSLGEAYGNAGRCGDSALAYEDAAEVAEPEARIPLRRRAASQHLFAGNVNRGRELIRDDLRAEGVPVPKTPGRTLVSVVRLRALIRLRGLELRKPESADIPAEALTFLDHLRSVAVVMSFVDVGLGAEIGARFLLRAQVVGDRHYYALGLALLAGHSGVEHPFTARTRYLLARMEREGGESKDASVTGTITAVRGLCHYFAGEWRSAVKKLDDAEGILANCQGFVCEFWSTRAVAIWSRFFLGDWEEMARRVLRGLDDARDRGNAYGMAGVCSPFGVSTWLGQGRPEEARRVLEEVTSTWRVEGFQIQDYWFLMAESLIHLSAGDGALAWKQMCAKWRSAAAPLTMRFPANKAQLLHMRGSCALAAAEQTEGAAKAELLQEAARAARRLRRVRIPYAQPLAQLLWAGVTARRGALSEASSLLESAITGLGAQKMAVYAAAARRRLARLRGEASADFLPGQHIADEDAVTRMLVPGLGPG